MCAFVENKSRHCKFVVRIIFATRTALVRVVHRSCIHPDPLTGQQSLHQVADQVQRQGEDNRGVLLRRDRTQRLKYINQQGCGWLLDDGSAHHAMHGFILSSAHLQVSELERCAALRHDGARLRQRLGRLLLPLRRDHLNTGDWTRGHIL